MNSGDFTRETEALTKKILKLLSSSAKTLTAWDLKMSLKVSHTRLHIALGALMNSGKVRLQPDSLTYVVEPITDPSVVTPIESKEPVVTGAAVKELS